MHGRAAAAYFALNSPAEMLPASRKSMPAAPKRTPSCFESSATSARLQPAHARPAVSARARATLPRDIGNIYRGARGGPTRPRGSRRWSVAPAAPGSAHGRAARRCPRSPRPRAPPLPSFHHELEPVNTKLQIFDLACCGVVVKCAAQAGEETRAAAPGGERWPSGQTGTGCGASTVPAARGRRVFDGMMAGAAESIDAPVLEAASEGEVVSCVSRSVQDALHVLHGLWADVGVESAERLQVCREIALDVDRALQAKISDARESKAQTALKIRLTHRRIRDIYAQLGTQPPSTAFACDDEAAADHPGDATLPGDAEKPQLGLRLQLGKLEQMLEAADAQRSQRLGAFTRMAGELRELLLEQYGTLDEERQGCLDLSGETDLSDAREQLLLKAISAGKAARDARARDIVECASSMRALWEVLGSDQDEQDSEKEQWTQLDSEVQAGGSGLQPSTAVLKKVKERLESLQALAEVRREAVAALVSSLELLWRRVEIPSAEQEAYKRQHAGITLQDIRHHEATLAELEKQLADMLPDLINASTARLETLQKALLEQESPSATVDNGAVTVVALEKLEAEIEGAEARLEQRQGVLALLERRDAILKEAAELKSAGQDPSRLLDKSAGSFRARQQEEKRRNMVSKELPRVTEKLRKAIGEWEQASGEPFVYLGRKYSDIMEEQRLEEERELEEERLRREEERQRIKAKRSGVCAPPGSSPCLAGMSASIANATPKAGACAANHTPRGAGAKTPLDRARASVPPKSPAAHHRSTPASSAGVKSGADRAGTAGKENADANPAALGTSQSAASRRGLFATPVAKHEGACLAKDGGDAGAVGAGTLAESVSTPTAASVQKSSREAEAPGSDARRGEGVGTSASKSEAVQFLEQRLALARQQITPQRSDAGKHQALPAPSPADVVSASQDPASGDLASRGEEAATPLEGEEQKAAEQGHSGEDGEVSQDVLPEDSEQGQDEVRTPVRNKDAVPFARWIASGCPIGTKSRVSGILCVCVCVFECVRHGAEGRGVGGCMWFGRAFCVTRIANVCHT